VEDERNSEVRREDCCGSGSNQANGSGADCGCGGAPPRRPWLRTLIAGGVILAAVGVGAYSLFGRDAADPKKQAASCCTAAAPAAGKAAPSGRSCCASGGTTAKCAAQPAKGADSTACKRTCSSR
jgi:hypothetical protein